MRTAWLMIVGTAGLGAAVTVPLAWFIDRFRPAQRYAIAWRALICWCIILADTIANSDWFWAVVYVVACWVWLEITVRFHPRPAHSSILQHPSSQKANP